MTLRCRLGIHRYRDKWGHGKPAWIVGDRRRILARYQCTRCGKSPDPARYRIGEF